MADEGVAKGEEWMLRAFRLGDADVASLLLQEAPEASKWSPEALRDCLKYPGFFAFVTERAGAICGFILGRRLEDEGEILNLAVSRTYRRKGVATAMTNELLGTFREQGVSREFLEVRESNAGAIAFYERLGFRRTGTRPGYYHHPEEAALVLVLGLKNS
jgi:[ribosomal protein S18]-alanine N-acetyltransferase